jgi:hypothetical protein
MPSLNTLKKSGQLLVVGAVALAGGVVVSQPANAGWKLCVQQQCVTVNQCRYYKRPGCLKHVCKNVLVDCGDGQEHVGKLNSTSDGGNF